MPDVSAILAHLNPEQRQAVEYIDGPLLVLAPAGSGKTRVIVHKIAYLVARGIRPNRILAVTFTNKAANEMLERCAHILNVPQSKLPVLVSTFHSFGLRLLRRYYKEFGIDGHASVIDEVDRDAILKQILSDLGASAKTVTLEEVKSFLNLVKGNGQSVQEASSQFGPVKGTVLKNVYQIYRQRLKVTRCLDFDDLILLPVETLQTKKELAEKISSQFDYILVDEYQDTNLLQARLLKLIAPQSMKVCVVGDDDQSIYSWRGARVENLLEFESQFPGCKVIKLTRNYRSGRRILAVASSLIKHNQKRHQKQLHAELSIDSKVEVTKFNNPLDEAEEVAAKISRFIRNREFSPSQIAVLVRTKGQMRAIQEQLRLVGVPYKVVGGIDFLDRQEVRTALAYFKLLVNPHDEASFRRVINFPPRGLGLKSLQRVEKQVTEWGCSLFEGLKRILNESPDLLPSRARAQAASFCSLIEEFGAAVKQNPHPDLLKEYLIKTGLKDHYIAAAPYRWRSIELLIKIYQQGLQKKLYSSVHEFLERITLQQYDSDKTDPDVETESVTLMTMHAAKGLEFDVVFVCGLVEGILPHEKSQSESQLEEERRLFYVAITRAKRILFISYFNERKQKGKSVPCRKSRFLDELPANQIELTAPMQSKQMDASQLAAELERLEKLLAD